MRKEFLYTVLSLSLLLNFGLTIYNLLKQPTITPSQQLQNIRGDISLNQGGVSSASTSNGDLWLFISNQNKIYYFSKPDSTGKIKISTDVLPR